MSRLQEYIRKGYVTAPKEYQNKKRCEAIWFAGYDEGYEHGRTDGYENGYDEGLDEGRDEAEIDIVTKEDLIDEGYDKCFDEHFGSSKDSFRIIFDKNLDIISEVVKNSPYLKELFLERVKERFG